MAPGFAIIPHALEEEHLLHAEKVISAIDRGLPGVMAGEALFAVRDVCSIVPQLFDAIWNPVLDGLVRSHIHGAPFLTRAILFDKPAASNWWVAHHQDLSIHVKEKGDVPGFSGWTHKHGMTGVVPPVHFLEHTLTVRIHFDDTDATNGALRVLPGSHAAGIRTVTAVDPSAEVVCNVSRGGVMLMRPLLFHASRRSTSDRPRRVLHLEFNDLELPTPLVWAEQRPLPS